MPDTIAALSSGAPPAALGIIRVSGPLAALSIERLAGSPVQPRRASLRTLRDGEGRLLDEAIVLWFPGPESSTGDDVAEFHCHGGRAVLRAVENSIVQLPGVRAAEPGEFTRRAFANGRIDLVEAEALADLLAAETELQRASAIANAGGHFSREVEQWRERLLTLSARVESVLDFSDEDDVADLPSEFVNNVAQLACELGDWLERPRSERLGEGFRVVLAGPPNVGKSTLFNALVESEAAITSPTAGTTRDVIERSVAISGIPFTFVDTAGLREQTQDAIERTGIDRARSQLDRADCVLWLGPQGEGPCGSREIAPREDSGDFQPKTGDVLAVSAVTKSGMSALKSELVALAKETMPKPGEATLNARQHSLLERAHGALRSIGALSDPLLVGEELRIARRSMDTLVGRATTEDMLDALFGRFCIGK